LPLATFKRMLKKLQDWIQKLEPADTGKTTWQDYTKTHSYSSEEVQNKKRFVAEFVSRAKPRLLWDLGCNTGDYSISALKAGVDYVVGFDFDQGALEAAFERARDGHLPFQLLFLDAANPTPNQGWKQQERAGLQERASADGILALALVHHLAITRNIPLDQVIDWLLDLAPRGVVEFVPKSDSMVQALLRLREDIFSDYRQEYFLAQFARRANVVKSEVVSSSGRLLVWYERN
jgi:ribosomal protein L11 methylase PrmA